MKLELFYEIVERIKIILPILTPFAVCYITLRSSKKTSEEAMKIQQKNHDENMVLSEKKYQEQLIINEENERLKYLPYLSIVPKYRENRFQGKMKKLDNGVIAIPLEIINEGAGIAFSVRLEYLDRKNTPEGIYGVTVAIQKNYNDGYDILGVREPIDTDVLQIGKKTEFCLHLATTNNSLEKIDPTMAIQWEFKILFCDIQERKYSQTYSFYTSIQGNNIFRLNSYMPQQIKSHQ